MLEQCKIFLKKVLSFLMVRIGLGCETEEETVNIFETGKAIVPDCIRPDEGEQPIKQYNVAKLRSRIFQKYADGRLQITNKRVLFRATGLSFTGRTALQYEFAISEIGGIEIKKANRLSFMNILLGLFVSMAVSSPLEKIFSEINNSIEIFSIILGCILTAILVVPFFVIKKHFWIKYIALSAAMGVMAGICSIPTIAFDISTGEFVPNILDIVLCAVTILAVVNLIILSFVPDLRICIKTKSASEAVRIRRKVRGFFGRQPMEYTDFSEVLPSEDTDRAINELGSLIDDIQTMGDYAIEKWKET